MNSVEKRWLVILSAVFLLLLLSNVYVSSARRVHLRTVSSAQEAVLV